MKKPSPTLVKGREAEERCMSLIRSLKGEIPIRRVYHTRVRFDLLGVDIIVYIRSPHTGRDVKVPIEVKSSYTGVCKYRERHPECVAAGVLLIIVSKDIPDANILRSLKHQFERILKENVDYSHFFELLRKKASQIRFPSLYNTLHERFRNDDGRLFFTKRRIHHSRHNGPT